MAIPHSLDVLLLCALRPGPDYGHALAQRFATLDRSFRPGPGALYPALRRLELAGLATSEEVPQRADRGGRPRRVYALTPKGKRRADQLAKFFGALAQDAQEAA
jgi:DNA-binding PadR family transcriptional regulator